MIFKVVNKQLRRDDESRLNFRRDSSSLFVSKSMARQIPSKSKHRIMAEKPARRSRSSTTRTTTTSSTRSSNTRSTTTSSTRTSTTPIVSHGAQAHGRLGHQEDNSAVESLPRVLDGLGSLQGSIETSLESTSLESTVSTPLVPAVILTPRRTSTPTVSWVLEPLYRTPVETANDSGCQVIEQLQAFFARQRDFNRRLEEQLEGHFQGQGRENRPTAQATRFLKALSVSHLSS